MKSRMALEQLLEERARRHGFNRVQTPIFESLELFTIKSKVKNTSGLFLLPKDVS
jgi:histidyl-tRNA synthetase